jgi:hypothetical protein
MSETDREAADKAWAEYLTIIGGESQIDTAEPSSIFLSGYAAGLARGAADIASEAHDQTRAEVERLSKS